MNIETFNQKDILIKLYDQDFNLWLETTANLLQNRQCDQIDYDNLIEEIEAMGRSEKHALESNLVVVLMHLLKYIAFLGLMRYSSSNEQTSYEYLVELLEP